MKVAVIGSRGLTVSNLGDYLPCDTTEIISGGAKGVDTCARDLDLCQYFGHKKLNIFSLYDINT